MYNYDAEGGQLGTHTIIAVLARAYANVAASLMRATAAIVIKDLVRRPTSDEPPDLPYLDRDADGSRLCGGNRLLVVEASYSFFPHHPIGVVDAKQAIRCKQAVSFCHDS